MKCAECNLWWKDVWRDYPSCHADPDWPAPCEYEEEWSDDDDDDPFHENDPYVVTNPMAFY